ncbi:MAG: Eco57I restriction-modification methylase domain-containing protein, partial [Blastocatellia bacterium]
FPATAAAGLSHALSLHRRGSRPAPRARSRRDRPRTLRALLFALASAQSGRAAGGLAPRRNAEARRFELATAGGNERKTSGSYYTPESLVQCLLDSALDPVLAEAARRDDPETAILDLKVCDPACGSGHFLIAAAHRMAKRLAAIRTGDDEPAPEATRTALRDVIGRCLYGVDLNPMAVELCKVSLWMEALEPGKPLSFLDHHIRLGNSLIGATPALLKKGIPDKAFNPIEGDDKAACAEARRLNKKFRESGQRSIFEPPIKLGALAESVLQLEAIDDRTIEGVREKQRRWEQLVNSNDYIYGGLLADAWCAAFVWRKVADPGHPAPITEELFRKIEQSPWHVVRDHCFEEICRLSAQYQFFHWHLEFPKVFRSALDGEEAEKQQARWHGGFDVVLGNPPWERIKLQEKEWFAQRSPEIANAPNAAARQRKIRELIDTDPDLHTAFLEDRRKSEGESHLARNGGRFPLCGVGDINTYAIFAETNRMLINERGRVGCILPSGIATDDTTKEFFQSIVEKSSLVSLYDFQSGPGLFGEIGHARFKFCLLTLTGPLRPQKDGAELAFFLRDVEHLRDADRSFRLSAEEIALLNPNTRTCPIFRSQRDSELTKAIYRRVPVLIREGKAKDDADENPWGIEFKRMIDMANDSGLFKTSSELLKEGWHLDGNIFRKETDSYLPLYEAKMLHHYTHRYGDYTDQPADSQNTSLPDVPVERLQRPEYVVQSRYWVPREDVIFKITRVPPDLLKAYRDGDEEGLRMAATRWLTGWENAHLSESDWEGLGAKERDAMRERRDRARRFLADYPLTRDDIAVLRRGREDLRDNVAALVEAKAPRWLLGWRDICRSTDERTVIASVLPLYGVGDKFLLMFPRHHPNLCATFLANMAAFAFDYCSRQKVGGTSLKYFTMRQLPVLPPSTYKQLCPWYLAQSLCEWIPPRVLELTYTAYDLRGFAEDCGYTGEPFRWDEARRFLLRCELDAAYFHLYGIGREDVDYILDTFPIVQRDDVKAHGEYRTKRVIMEIYDAMTEAIATGAPYRTRLEPPPANGWTPPARAKEEAIGEPPSSEDVSQGELFGWRKEDPQQSFRFGEEEG